MIDNTMKFQGISQVESAAVHAESASHGFLSRAPFTWTRRNETTLPVTLEGQPPAWLRGDLLRTAPAVFDTKSWHANHWFDALGLIYSFSFGEQVAFKQRLLQSKALKDAHSDRQQVTTFDTPTRRSLWQRLLKPVPYITDNANVNIIPWQGTWLAMTESPNQHMVDGETLASRGLYRYEDKLPAAALSVHPHFDFERKTLINMATSFGPKNVLRIYSQSTTSHSRKVEGELAFKRVPYLHSFGLSERHAVIIDHPYTVNPLKLLFSNRGFIDPFEWQPERGTKLWKLERATGKWSAYQTEPLFCFHTVNAFDDGDDVVMDFIAYDDASVVAKLKTANLDRSLPQLAARFVRARLKPGKRDVELELLSERGFEFPSIPYRAHNGRAYDVAWGTRVAETSTREAASEIVRVDPSRGEVARYSETDVIYGEPVFVPRPEAKRSDDGVLLAVGSHADKEQATLVVLTADTLQPVARAHVDLCLPLGFHGSFLAAR